MNLTYYRIAGHVFSVSFPVDTEISYMLPSFEPFRFEYREKEPVLFTINFVWGVKNKVNGTKLTAFEWEGAECSIYRDAGCYEVLVYPNNETAPYAMYISKDFSTAQAQLHGIISADAFVANNFLMMLYAFSSASRDTLMFHASVIRKEGFAYLFLGKSGTGKSTHSRLWLEYIPDTELLNDDNPIVRLFPNGKVMVYGSPWSGKTPCYRNEEAPVGAFVRLEQAPANSIDKVNFARAFATLMPSCSCLKQDENQYIHICNTLISITSKIPIFKLECLPDGEAAELCHSTIAWS